MPKIHGKLFVQGSIDAIIWKLEDISGKAGIGPQNQFWVSWKYPVLIGFGTAVL